MRLVFLLNEMELENYHYWIVFFCWFFNDVMISWKLNGIIVWIAWRFETGKCR